MTEALLLLILPAVACGIVWLVSDYMDRRRWREATRRAHMIVYGHPPPTDRIGGWPVDSAAPAGKPVADQGDATPGQGDAR